MGLEIGIRSPIRVRPIFTFVKNNLVTLVKLDELVRGDKLIVYQKLGVRNADAQQQGNDKQNNNRRFFYQDLVPQMNN